MGQQPCTNPVSIREEALASQRSCEERSVLGVLFLGCLLVSLAVLHRQPTVSVRKDMAALALAGGINAVGRGTKTI